MADTIPFNGLIRTAQSNGLYSNTVIGTLAVDRWAVTFGTARRRLGGFHNIIPCGSIITFAL